jgi:hypothetical protein
VPTTTVVATIRDATGGALDTFDPTFGAASPLAPSDWGRVGGGARHAPRHRQPPALSVARIGTLVRSYPGEPK